MEESTSILEILKALRNGAWLQYYNAQPIVDIKSQHGPEGYVSHNTFFHMLSEKHIQKSHAVNPGSSIFIITETGKEFVQNGLNQPKTAKNI